MPLLLLRCNRLRLCQERRGISPAENSELGRSCEAGQLAEGVAGIVGAPPGAVCPLQRLGQVSGAGSEGGGAEGEVEGPGVPGGAGRAWKARREGVRGTRAACVRPRPCDVAAVLWQLACVRVHAPVCQGPRLFAGARQGDLVALLQGLGLVRGAAGPAQAVASGQAGQDPALEVLAGGQRGDQHVLVWGGRHTLRGPHNGIGRSAATLRYTHRSLQVCFGHLHTVGVEQQELRQAEARLDGRHRHHRALRLGNRFQALDGPQRRRTSQLLGERDESVHSGHGEGAALLASVLDSLSTLAAVPARRRSASAAAQGRRTHMARLLAGAFPSARFVWSVVSQSPCPRLTPHTAACARPAAHSRPVQGLAEAVPRVVNCARRCVAARSL